MIDFQRLKFTCYAFNLNNSKYELNDAQEFQFLRSNEERERYRCGRKQHYSLA
jgi:hypothetical protein